MDKLVTGPVFRFGDWPSDQVPRRAAGVYTVRRREEFVYVGIGGRGASAEDFIAAQGSGEKAKGLRTRLNSYASGRPSGDQFNVYICDRFVVPVLTPSQQRDIRRGEVLLDRLTKDFIRRNLSYRFEVYPSGKQALAIERGMHAGRYRAGRPYLNPLYTLAGRY